MPFLLKDSKKLIKGIVVTIAYANNLPGDFHNFCDANLINNFSLISYHLPLRNIVGYRLWACAHSLGINNPARPIWLISFTSIGIWGNLNLISTSSSSNQN